jgi:hypothetical protein
MTYQLQLRIDDQWTTACFGEKPLALAEYAKVAKRHTTAIGHRVFKADRKRLKNGELAGAPKPCRKQSPGVRHPRDLAKDAAEHIKKTGQKTIHVYPLGKTGSHASNQFRKYLFGELTDRVAQWWTDVDRVKSEAIAVKEFGYTIIEVDPAEWVFTPDLEEAA